MASWRAPEAARRGLLTAIFHRNSGDPFDQPMFVAPWLTLCRRTHGRVVGQQADFSRLSSLDLLSLVRLRKSSMCAAARTRWTSHRQTYIHFHLTGNSAAHACTHYLPTCPVPVCIAPPKCAMAPGCVAGAHNLALLLATGRAWRGLCSGRSGERWGWRGSKPTQRRRCAQ